MTDVMCRELQPRLALGTPLPSDGEWRRTPSIRAQVYQVHTHQKQLTFGQKAMCEPLLVLGESCTSCLEWISSVVASSLRVTSQACWGPASTFGRQVRQACCWTKLYDQRSVRLRVGEHGGVVKELISQGALRSNLVKKCRKII